MAGSDTLKKFGKYFLLDLVAQGGMAEIYRARMATPDGGGRLLAIKRIIATYSQNIEFVTMFKAEIKTTSGFNHPNIVQLYDYGEEQGMLYIAMEFVDGRNLRQFISRFSELKSTFPVEVSVFIIEQAAHGMAYAHGYKDKFSGKNLNIVHRDISPQNVLISYDGAVKVIDFGIAKAVTNAEATRAGVIKGKPSYLSPEQVSGEPLDGRSDIFALGIVLWELLSGRKLFASDNDYGVLKLIENCTTNVKPPSLYNPKVPKELDAIVLKCLQKNREHRYQTAEELQRALHKFLYQYTADFNPADLAYYARDLFKNEIVEDRRRLLKLNDKVEQLLLVQQTQEKTTPNIEQKASKGGVQFKEDSTVALSKDDSTESEMPGKPKAGTKEAGSFRMVDFKDEKTDVALDFGPGGKAKTNTNPLTSKAGTGAFAPTASNPGFGRATTTGLKKSQKTASRSPMAAAVIVALLGGAYWYYTQQRNEESPTVVGGGTILVQGNVKAATITIDEKSISSNLPAELKGLATDHPLRVSVSANGYKKYSESVQLTSGEKKVLNATLARADTLAPTNPQATEIANSGKMIPLRISINPPGLGTQIRLNGLNVDTSGITAAPAGTSLELVVEREGFRTFRKSFMIDPAKMGASNEFVMDVALAAAKFGYVTIKTTPSAEAIVTIDGVEEKWSTPISRKRVPIGQYKAKLVNAVLGMEKEVTFNVSEDRFTNIEERLNIQEDTPQHRVPSSDSGTR